MILGGLVAEYSWWKNDRQLVSSGRDKITQAGRGYLNFILQAMGVLEGLKARVGFDQTCVLERILTMCGEWIGCVCIWR